MKKEKIVYNSRAQVTLFIIIAIVLVALIILFFALRGKISVNPFAQSMPNPEEYIDKCARDSVSEAIKIMLPQGGYLSPENFKLYKNNKIQYLCYNANYYYPCINQEPMYLEHLEAEITKYIEPKIKDCFFAMENEYKDKGYSITSGSQVEVKTRLINKQVEIQITKKLNIAKNEESKKFDKFVSRIPSPLYSLAITAQEIASQEAKFCNFEYMGYSLFYPTTSVQKDQTGSGKTASKIYIIKDSASKKELLIAIRSCAMPPGL